MERRTVRRRKSANTIKAKTNAKFAKKEGPNGKRTVRKEKDSNKRSCKLSERRCRKKRHKCRREITYRYQSQTIQAISRKASHPTGRKMD